MALRLKGRAPQPGQLDRRYYMIDVQVGNRRARLSSGVRDRALAEAREQLTLDALRADRDIPHTALVELIRGRAPRTRPVASPLLSTSLPLTLKQACDQALQDRLPWGRSRRGWADSPSRATYAGQLKDIQRILGPSLPVTRINQASVDAIIGDLRGERAAHRGAP